jgi:PIN domain nuclease of toxin-antitoxin system
LSVLFIDSNVLLWWLTDHPRLAQSEARDRINSADQVYLSVVSPWELWIKSASGRLPLPDDLTEQINQAGFTLLSPALADARLAADLPPIHKDLFDRMIVAQALNRDATLITGDRQLAAYGVKIILI